MPDSINNEEFSGDMGPFERMRTSILLLRKDLRYLEEKQNDRHNENIKSAENFKYEVKGEIADVKNNVSRLTKEVSSMKLQIAKWAGGAGVMTAIAIVIMQTLAKKAFHLY